MNVGLIQSLTRSMPYCDHDISIDFTHYNMYNVLFDIDADHDFNTNISSQDMPPPNISLDQSHNTDSDMP